MIHHSDRDSQYLSIRYTERQEEAGIDRSVGSVGDSYDNALAESIIGVFKIEVLNGLGPWKSVSQIEWETVSQIEWETVSCTTQSGCTALPAMSRRMKQRRIFMQHECS